MPMTMHVIFGTSKRQDHQACTDDTLNKETEKKGRNVPIGGSSVPLTIAVGALSFLVVMPE